MPLPESTSCFQRIWTVDTGCCRFVPVCLCALSAETQLALKMSATKKRKAQTEPKVFHARMVVTRTEEWWVEAETFEKAEQLLEAGQGHRHVIGEVLHVDFDEILVEDVLEDVEN
jgi:hypothetical protein